MKIVVYAICKNESGFVDRWMDSMQEADRVIVLDTGSTDDTVQKLRSRGARVYEEQFSPWRFDTARNRSLELVDDDADLCVCTDLDEYFLPGWRAELERVWSPGVTQVRYPYVWSFRADGSDGVTFWYEKIHARHGYKWTHPVHEVLSWIGEGTPGKTADAPGMRLEHHPDPAKSRGQYLPLLELSVREDPDDDRNTHYLGREYFYYRRWDDCIRTLKKHLAMPNALWADERAASMRYIASSYSHKGQPDEAVRWYLRAAAEAPHLREPLTDLALELYYQKDWHGVLFAAGRALRITKRPRTYICEADAWGSLPWDLMAVAYYNIGRNTLALEYALQALELDPGNERLQNNVRLLRELEDAAALPPVFRDSNQLPGENAE